MKNKTYTGINIQWPISELIIAGKKLIETRTYPLPSQYLNKEMLLVETPGKSGKFKSRIIGIIKFTECFRYQSKKEFYNDYDKHFVSKDSPWAWKSEPKWGWVVLVIKKIDPPKDIGSKRGIVYRKNLTL